MYRLLSDRPIAGKAVKVCRWEKDKSLHELGPAKAKYDVCSYPASEFLLVRVGNFCADTAASMEVNGACQEAFLQCIRA